MTDEERTELRLKAVIANRARANGGFLAGNSGTDARIRAELAAADAVDPYLAELELLRADAQKRFMLDAPPPRSRDALIAEVVAALDAGCVYMGQMVRLAWAGEHGPVRPYGWDRDQLAAALRQRVDAEGGPVLGLEAL